MRVSFFPMKIKSRNGLQSFCCLFSKHLFDDKVLSKDFVSFLEVLKALLVLSSCLIITLFRVEMWLAHQG